MRPLLSASPPYSRKAEPLLRGFENRSCDFLPRAPGYCRRPAAHRRSGARFSLKSARLSSRRLLSADDSAASVYPRSGSFLCGLFKAIKSGRLPENAGGICVFQAAALTVAFLYNQNSLFGTALQGAALRRLFALQAVLKTASFPGQDRSSCDVAGDERKLSARARCGRRRSKRTYTSPFLPYWLPRSPHAGAFDAK